MKTTIKTNHTRRGRPAKPVSKPGRSSLKLAEMTSANSLLKPKRILVPIDFSKASLKALRYAVPFAKQFGVQLYLVSVVENNSFLNGVENIALVVPDQALAEEARIKLRALAADEIEEMVPVNVQVKSGKPFNEIIRLARDLDIDLIVIGTHGYTGLKHALLGSTAERVVRHAPCPVLVVREKEKEFVQR